MLMLKFVGYILSFRHRNNKQWIFNWSYCFKCGKYENEIL